MGSSTSCVFWKFSGIIGEDLTTKFCLQN